MSSGPADITQGFDSGALDERRLRQLIEVGRSLVAELDPEVVFRRLLEVACELTGARYAALGVLDEDRHELERFITRGIDEEERREIGNLPRLGIAGHAEDDDVVLATVLMRRGEQTLPTIHGVQEEVARINAGGVLPPGVDRDLERVRVERFLEDAGLIPPLRAA